MLARLLCSLLLVAPFSFAQSASTEQATTDQLRMVVILTRHGVRSPLSLMSDFGQDPWPKNQPDWNVDCCGDLTPAGEYLVRLMGAYYHDYYSDRGLLSRECPAQEVYIWADNEERTIQTGRQLAQGLAAGSRGCSIAVNSLAYDPCNPAKSDEVCQRGQAGPNDPIFHHPASSETDPELQKIADSINARFKKLVADHAEQLEALRKTLCRSGTCMAGLDHAEVKDGKLSWGGRFSTGSTASEVFLLEYANGMPCSKVGWGRVVFAGQDCTGPGQAFRTMQEIHTAYFQETQRAPYIAAMQGTNLLNHLVEKLEDGLLPKPPQKLVIYSGHDTNIANVAAMLGLSWKLPDLPDNDTPPAGALVFELRYNLQTRDYSIHVRYVYQMLDQLRTQAVLTLQNPPKWIELTVPACPGDCTLEAFTRASQPAKQVGPPRPKAK